MMLLVIVISSGMTISGLGGDEARTHHLPAAYGRAEVGRADLGHRRLVFSSGRPGFVRSLWRNSFYLNYPSLDFLDHNLPITAALVIPVKSLLVIVTAILTLLGLHFFVNRTRMGMAIRAVAQYPTRRRSWECRSSGSSR